MRRQRRGNKAVELAAYLVRYTKDFRVGSPTVLMQVAHKWFDDSSPMTNNGHRARIMAAAFKLLLLNDSEKDAFELYREECDKAGIKY